MASVKQIICLVLSVISVILSFYSVGKLAVFLATPAKKIFQNYFIDNIVDQKTKVKSTFALLFFDLILVILFILQHSLMKGKAVKQLYTRLNWENSERSIYNIATGLTLLLLVNNWKPISSLTVWSFDVEDYSILWYGLIGIHIFLWFNIYGGSLLMDLPELLGIKQTYYDIVGLAHPLKYKHPKLCQLLDEIRHPSFICITIILWLTNMMRYVIDRIILKLKFILCVFIISVWIDFVWPLFGLYTCWLLGTLVDAQLIIKGNSWKLK